ncbi:MAG: hypothetical protein ACOCRK_04700 [bacterium]
MSETIKSLLEQIRDKELVLPEFQREYTWSRTQVKDLFNLIIKKLSYRKFINLAY